MALFATTYRYLDDGADALAEVRPAHRDYLGQLSEQGSLLISGPYVGGEPGALLVFEAESEADVHALVEADPFRQAGLIEHFSVREWQPVLGRLSSQV